MLFFKYLWNMLLELLGVGSGATVVVVYDIADGGGATGDCILILEEGTFDANATTLVDLQQSGSDGVIVEKFSEDVEVIVEVRGTDASQFGTAIIYIAHYIKAVGKTPIYDPRMQLNVPINGTDLIIRALHITPPAPTRFFDVGKIQIISAQNCYIRTYVHCGHKPINVSDWRP